MTPDLLGQPRVPWNLVDRAQPRVFVMEWP